MSKKNAKKSTKHKKWVTNRKFIRVKMYEHDSFQIERKNHNYEKSEKKKKRDRCRNDDVTLVNEANADEVIEIHGSSSEEESLTLKKRHKHSHRHKKPKGLEFYVKYDDHPQQTDSHSKRKEDRTEDHRKEHRKHKRSREREEGEWSKRDRVLLENIRIKEETDYDKRRSHDRSKPRSRDDRNSRQKEVVTVKQERDRSRVREEEHSRSSTRVKEEEHSRSSTRVREEEHSRSSTRVKEEDRSHTRVKKEERDRSHVREEERDRSHVREEERDRSHAREDRGRRERSPPRVKQESREGQSRVNEREGRRPQDQCHDRIGRNRGRRQNIEDEDVVEPAWGAPPDSTQPDQADPADKQKPDFKLSGKLTEDRNTCNGVVIKYSEPPEARMPKKRWRLYQFKGEEALPTLYIHRQSAYLIGRDRKVADLPVDHPSCSKQHAALQYRLVTYERANGTIGKQIRLYVIDLESANGTFINGKKIDAKKYVELLEKDVIKFGFSSREYVLLHEQSKDQELSDDEAV